MDNKENLLKKYKYPSQYELVQSIGKLSTRRFTENFAKEKGIFITKASQTELAKELGKIFFEHNEIEKIRDAAYRLNTKRTLSGFLVKAIDPDFDLGKFFDELKSNPELKKSEIILSQIVKEEGSEIMKASIDYVKRTPGKIEFLQEEHRSFEFRIEEIEEGSWKVLVNCNKSNDAKVLEKLIEKYTDKKTISFEELDYDLLSSEQTIEFFDKLAYVGMPEEWKFMDIKHLVFRKGESEPDEEIGEEELSGIRQAKLDGKNLRENSFVRQSEKAGYRFTAMTYEFQNREKATAIEITAEFKMRPKVFEIYLKSFKRKIGVGIGATFEKGNIDLSHELSIKNHFWNRAKMVYNKIINGEPITIPTKSKRKSKAVK